MDWVDKSQNCKDLYGILQLLRGSHLAFHSVTFQLKCLDFQSNQYEKLVPVLSRFCNWLSLRLALIRLPEVNFPQNVTLRMCVGCIQP